MRYLAVGGWLLVTAIGGPLASDVAAGEDGQLRVATFCSDVTQPLGSPTYPSGKPLETVETPLLAKGIVLDDGRQRIVLCAIDWCGLCGPAHSLVRQKLAAGADTDVSHVTVHTVHQHTAPYVPIDSLEPQDQTGNLRQTLLGQSSSRWPNDCAKQSRSRSGSCSRSTRSASAKPKSIASPRLGGFSPTTERSARDGVPARSPICARAGRSHRSHAQDDHSRP